MSPRPMHDPKLQKLGGGTVGYYPPTERGRSEKSDVFALGVILLCLLTGSRNFLQHKHLMDQVIADFMEQPRQVSTGGANTADAASAKPEGSGTAWTAKHAGETLNKMLVWVRTMLGSNHYDPYFPLHDLSDGVRNDNYILPPRAGVPCNAIIVDSLLLLGCVLALRYAASTQVRGVRQLSCSAAPF